MQIYKPYCYIISILAIPFIFLGVSHYFLDFPSFLASYNYLKKLFLIYIIFPILNLRFIFHSFARYYRYF
ncbi:hypothetical protein ECC29_07535 [Helicobacter pylori]|nr:hypothetical protein ECC29_07535 [Helicobacter pylori]